MPFLTMLWGYIGKPFITFFTSIVTFFTKGAGFLFMFNKAMLFFWTFRVVFSFFLVGVVIWLMNLFVPYLINDYGSALFSSLINVINNSAHASKIYNMIFVLSKVGFFDGFSMFLACVIYTNIIRMMIAKVTS